MTVIKEGTVPTKAFLVRKGELNIVSSEIPKLLKINTTSNTGYFSSTINSFQLGKITENEWAGHEMLIFKNQPMPFSVIASTFVDVLEISKSNLLTKFHNDILINIEINAKEKFKFIQERAIEISKSMKKISYLDKYHELFDEKTTEVAKRYPQASKVALNNFKLQQVFGSKSPISQSEKWTPRPMTNFKQVRRRLSQDNDVITMASAEIDDGGMSVKTMPLRGTKSHK